MFLAENQLITLGHITDSQSGPLSITVVGESEISVTDVLYGGKEVSALLLLGADLTETLSKLSALQQGTTTFPLEKLQRMTWNNLRNDVVFEFRVNNATKRVSTCISGNTEIDTVRSRIESHLGRKSRVREEAIPIFRTIWAQLLGMTTAILGTGFIYTNWDNFNFDNIRYGAIPEMLGRTGCVVVGIGLVAACMISAWWELKKSPTYYYVTF